MSKLLSSGLSFLLLICSLAACGGGGGGSPPPIVAPEPTVTGVDIGGAWRNYLSAPHTWVIPGTGSDGRNYQLTIDMKPGAARAFALTGATASTTEQTLKLTVTGGATDDSSGTLFFNTDGGMVGVYDGGACAAARALAALPGASASGTTGALFVLDGYTGCTKASPINGATTFTWSVASDVGMNLFCITSQEANSSGTVVGTEVDCIEAAANGSLGSRAKFTISRPDGTSITGKNY